MFYDQKIWVASAGENRERKVTILPKMANRHGLIAGATGTGKTVTLKVMAESFSDCGVPVFLADVKGDLAGMCRPGSDSADMQERIQKFGLSECGFNYHSYPVTFWDPAAHDDQRDGTDPAGAADGSQRHADRDPAGHFPDRR